MKFQVVILDNQDYIIEYKDFPFLKLDELEKFIGYWLTYKGDRGINIKITRWNSIGERT